jgi:hypothetical protein
MGWVVATEDRRLRETADEERPAERRDERPAYWLRQVGWTIPTLGLGILLLYALQFPAAEFVSVVATGLMILGAGMLAGSLVGFLFGIPRTLQGSGPPLETPTTETADTRQPAYLVNTNLEQISDWLTKILVGVGLVQLGKIADGSGRLVDFLAAGLGGRPSSRVLAAGLMTYSTVSGFLTGYLMTRVTLTPLFRRADVEGLRARVEKAEEASRQATSAVRDVLALGLVDQQLTPKPGDAPVDQDALTEALRAATPPLLAQAYTRAQRQREASWRRDKATMERTIPVFRALIATDPDERYHRNQADLGYALKDKLQPDYAAAEAALSEAIRIRDDHGGRGWKIYEFNRALSRIALDEHFAGGQPAAAEVRETVLDDLRAAASRDPPRRLVEHDEVIARWLDVNGMSLDDVTGATEAAR